MACMYLLTSLCLFTLSSSSGATQLNLSPRQYVYRHFNGQTMSSQLNIDNVHYGTQHANVQCSRQAYSKDKTCYILETLNGHLLKSCADGTAFHEAHCACDSITPAGHFADHDCTLAHSGHTVYVSANNVSGSYAHVSVSDNHASSCSNIHSYNALLHFKTDCGAAARAWSDLKRLYDTSSVCYRHLTSQMSNYFQYNTHSNCSCYDRSHSSLSSHHTGSYKFSQCINHEVSFQRIVSKALSRQTACGHDAGWYDFNKVSDYCMHTMFSVLEDLEPHLYCHCNQVTYPPTTSSTTVTSTTTTLSTAAHNTAWLAIPSSTPSFVGLHSCNELATITALARNNRVPCAGSNHSRPEAAITSLCKAPSPLSWTRGYKVKENCGSIPPYTAIATFIGNTYPDDGQAGVYIGCNSTSISMVVQSCEDPLEVILINAGNHGRFTDLMDSYFTIA